MPRVNYTRPYLYPKQAEFVDCTARYTVVEASTKSGKTFACIIWLLERAMMGKKGQNYWWVAPVFQQSEIAYKRLKTYINNPALFKANESKLTITLANGAIINFKSAEKPDSLYGEDVYAAVLDEATRQRPEAWHAVRSTLTATKGPVKIIGNVKGRKNWAFRMARDAETGTASDMAYFKLTAYDAIEGGIFDAKELEDAQRQLPEAVFKELYLAEPSDDGGNPFGLAAIEACIAPLSDGDPTIWGWDLARSKDWTVGIALDDKGAVCRFERWQAPWRSSISDILHLTKTTPALVDSTGVGDAVLEELQVARDNFEGYKFTGPSKQHLMEGLRLAIQQRSITFPDGPIVFELENFEYEYTRTGVRYSAPSGMNDDTVMALALAVTKSGNTRRSELTMFLAGYDESKDNTDLFSEHPLGFTRI